MVARFDYQCSCGHPKFTATGYANDMPLGESDDEWKSRLIFTCEKCAQEVTRVVRTMAGKVDVESELSRVQCKTAINGGIRCCGHCGARFVAQLPSPATCAECGETTRAVRSDETCWICGTCGSGGGPFEQGFCYNCGSHRRVYERKEKIGQYTILRRLGFGGFGEVFLGEAKGGWWRGRDLHLYASEDRKVAIKVFRPKYESLIASATSSTEEGVEILRSRFISEAKILASLADESNIVTLVEDGELDDGSPFYVMPYLPSSLADELGRDVFDASALAELPDHRRPKALPLARSLEILEQVLTGLAAAHRKGLVHRDIKPSNVMFSESGELQLVDFGIAKAPDGELTVEHIGLGSRNYMAPEQRESAKHVDARADVYAVGVVAYRMLTGKLPIGRFADPNIAVPALGQPMNDLLLTMMAVGKTERPNDAGDALAQFRNARQSVGQEA